MRQLFTSFTFYILIQQTSQTIFSPEQQAQQLTLNLNWNPKNLLVGTIFKYCPFGEISQIGEVQRSQTTQYLLYLALDQYNQAINLLHYVSFNIVDNSITHIIKFNLNNNIYELNFVMDNFNYEGIWYSQYIYYDENNQEIVAQISSHNMQINKNIKSSIFFSDNLQMIYGGSYRGYDKYFNQDYKLSSFPGKLKMVWLETIETFNHLEFNLYICESNQIQSLIKYQHLQNQIISKNTLEEFESNYMIQFWFKISNITVHDQQIIILDLIITSNQDYQHTIILHPFILKYIKYQNKWTQQLQYYTYQYPYIFQNIEQNIQIQNLEFDIDEQYIQNWHFIKIIYFKNDITFQSKSFIQNNFFYKILSDIYQFTNTKFTIILNGNNNEKDLILEYGEVQYKNCIAKPNKSDYSNCHYSCFTCFGPLENQCIQCHKSSNRIFDPNQNTCNCKMWYLDVNENICIGNEEVDLKLYKINEVVKDSSKCEFGYFSYNGNCYQCPSASQDGSITCIDCLMNPDTWVNLAWCEEEYSQIQKDVKNVYTYRRTEGFAYLFIDEELVQCDNCSQCTQEDYLDDIAAGVYTDCIIYPGKHLNKITYIQCDVGYFVPELKKCKPEEYDIGNFFNICDPYCGYCAFRQCRYCKDASKYYVDWSSKCRVCNIKNCKYCFQYNIYDRNQVTARDYMGSNSASHNEEDYIVSCSLCNKGYIFDFLINECILYQISTTCENGFKSLNGELICISSSLPRSQLDSTQIVDSGGCELFFSNCIRCVSDNYGMTQCIQCQDGYFLNYINGVCISCDLKLKNTKRCEMQTSSYDSWKYEVMSFYNNFLPDKTPVLLSGYYFIQYYNIVECQDGYVYHWDSCQINTDSNCQIWSQLDKFQCQTCNLFTQGLQALSFFDGSCQICLYPCTVCYQRDDDDLKKYNQYFLLNEKTIYQTYKCLLNIDSNVGYINSIMSSIQEVDDNKQQTYVILEREIKSNQDELTELQNQYFLIRNPYTIINKYLGILPDIPINLRNYFFSLKNSTLIYYGLNQQISNHVQIYNQTKVILQDFTISVNNILVKISSYLGVEVMFSNIKIQNIISKINIFQFQNITNLTIEDVIIQSVIFNNTQLFSIDGIYKKESNITLITMKNIQFIDCTFYNSSIMQLQVQDKQIYSISFENISFINCKFFQGKLLQFNNIISIHFFSIDNINFNQTIIEQSTFLDMPKTFLNNIYQINLQNCKLINSIIIQQTNSLVLKNLIILQSSFFNSQLFSLSGLLESQIYSHQFIDFQLQNISISGISLFSSSYKDDYQGIIQFKNLNFKNINSIIKSKQKVQQTNQICLFELQNQNIDIDSFIIDSFSDIKVFCTKKVYNLTIQNLLIKNQFYLEGITHYQQGLLSVKEFSYILIKNVIITENVQYNSPMIQIISNGEASLHQSIVLDKISLTNNKLIKNLLTQVSTLIYILSEFYCQVELNNIIFYHNIIQHVIEDSQTISPGLLFIEVKESRIAFTKISIISNDIRNTSNSLCYLKTYEILINNIEASNINTNDSLLSTANGGIGQIFSSKVIIMNGKFENIFAGQGGCFYIILLDLGYVYFDNLIIQNIQTQNTKVYQSIGGAFIIDASNSKLSFYLYNLELKNIMSRNSGGFVFLTASQTQNNLIMSNVTFTNVLSTSLGLFQFQCEEKVIKCSIFLNKILIFIDDLFYQQFLEYSTQNSTNLNEYKKSMISIISKEILINNLIIEGQLPLQGLYLSYQSFVNINLIKIMRVSLYGSSIIYIENNYCKNDISSILNQIQVNNIQISSTNTSKTIKEAFLLINYKIKTFNIKPLKLYLDNIQLVNNNCSSCVEGLVHLNFEQIVQIINFNQIYLLQNFCFNSSCITITQNNQNQINQIKIINGKFIYNSGCSKGVIKLIAQNVNLENLVFRQNIGLQGGAIHLSQYPLNSTKNVYFIQNSAQIAGALFMERTGLSKENLQQMLFLSNKGLIQVNNLQEEPQKLMMSIFNSDIETSSKGDIDMPNLRKYQKYNYLYLPSGQKIGSYKIFSQKELEYHNYDLNLKFYMISILGEKLNYVPDNQNVCKLSIIQKYDEKETYKILSQVLNFDLEESTINFADITLTFDPYTNEQNFLTLQIECEINSKQILQYQFNVRSFKCQMGEYFYESKCLECDYTKGYYSFEPKSSICQKVDPVSIIKNTANQIELNPGYWRPTIKSSDIVKCSKYSNSCQGGWTVGDKSCQIGHIGGLCEECDIYNIRGYGQYFLNSNFLCQKCEDFAERIIITVLITLLTLYSTYLTINSAQLIFIYFRRLKYTTPHYRIIFRLGLDQSAALIKMIVNYFQILNAINQFQLDTYSNIFGIINPFSNPVGTSLYSFDCFLSQQSAISIIYVNLITNLLVPIFYYLLFITLYLLIVFFQKKSLSVTIYLTGFLYLLFYTQPSIFKELGGLAAQRQIASIIYINQNVQYLYFTQTHETWLTFLIIPMIILLGLILPLIILYILFKIRKSFNQEQVRKLWGYLFNDYQESSFYWEIVRIFQRQIIILALTFYQEQIIIKGCIIIIIIICYYAIVLYFRPYNIQSLNYFELQNIFICGIIIIMSCLKYQTQTSNLIYADEILSYIFLCVFFYFLLRILLKLIHIYYQKYAEKFNNLKTIILNNFPQIIMCFPVLKKLLRPKEKNKVMQKFQIAFLIIKNFKNQQQKTQMQTSQIRQPTFPNENTIQLSFNQERGVQSIKFNEEQVKIF